MNEYIGNLCEAFGREMVTLPAWAAHVYAYEYLEDFYAKAIRLSEESTELVNAYRKVVELSDYLFNKSDLYPEDGKYQKLLWEVQKNDDEFVDALDDVYKKIAELDEIPPVKTLSENLLDVLTNQYAKVLYLKISDDSVDISNRDFYKKEFPKYQQQTMDEIVNDFKIAEADNISALAEEGNKAFGHIYLEDCEFPPKNPKSCKFRSRYDY